MQQRLAEFDICPKIIPTYEKSTQTVSIQTDDDDEIDIPIMKVAETPAQDSQKSKSEPIVKENIPEPIEEELSEIEIQRMLYSQELAEFLDDATRVTERALLINNKFDILANYKGEEGDDQKASKTNILLQNTLKDDRWTRNRAVTSVSWSPKVRIYLFYIFISFMNYH